MQNYKCVVIADTRTYWAIAQVRDDEPFPEETAIRMAITQLRGCGEAIRCVEIEPLERVGDVIAMVKQTAVADERDQAEVKDKVRMWP